MALIKIILSTSAGELASTLREVPDPESVTETVIQWLMDDGILLSAGDSVSIEELE